MFAFITFPEESKEEKKVKIEGVDDITIFPDDNVYTVFIVNPMWVNYSSTLF